MENVWTPERIAGTKALWQQCFHDDPQWVECFYRHFSPITTCRALTDGNGERVTSTLYSVGHFRFTCFGETFPASYLYALCTHPDCRSRGLMGSLIADTLQQLHHAGYGVAVLIPAEEWLFDYYARFGFAPLFRRRRLSLQARAISSTEGWSLYPPTDEEAMQFQQRHTLPREGLLQHTDKTWGMVMDDLHLSQGLCLGIRQQHEAAKAMALLYPEESGWLLRHEAADTPETAETLRQLLADRYKEVPLSAYQPGTDAHPGSPFGMVRILSAPRLLQAYARQHPEAALTYRLSDPLIEENNGLFRIVHGDCSKENPPQATAAHRTPDIGRLAEELLAPLHPYMSLMWE